MTNYLTFFKGDLINFQYGFDNPSKDNLIVPPDAHHDKYEVLYVKEGLIHHSVNGEFFNVHSGELLLINIGTIHNLNIDLSVPYERYALHFKLEIVPEKYRFLFNSFSSSNESNNVFPAEAINKTRIPELFDKINAALSENKELLAVSYVIQFLYALQELNDNSQYEKKPVKIDRLTKLVIDYISTHSEDNIVIDDIANALFVNKYYLSHVFKASMGISVKKYIIKEKMKQAKILIKNAGISPSATANRLGYKNYNVFYKNYVNIFGESPRATKK